MRRCKNCEVDISERHGKALYCSDACAELYRTSSILEKTIEKECKTCKAMFKPRPYHQDDQVFCSNKCTMVYMGRLRAQGLLQSYKDEENIINLVDNTHR